jgi:hypothetical protein
MGDRTPLQFLWHLRHLAPDVSDSLIRSIWTSHLPSYLQTPLLCLTDSPLNSAAASADRLIQSRPSPSLNLTSTPPTHSASVDRRSSSGERSSYSNSQYRYLHRPHEPRHQRSNSRERPSPSSDRLTVSVATPPLPNTVPQAEISVVLPPTSTPNVVHLQDSAGITTASEL